MEGSEKTVSNWRQVAGYRRDEKPIKGTEKGDLDHKG